MLSPLPLFNYFKRFFFDGYRENSFPIQSKISFVNKNHNILEKKN